MEQQPSETPAPDLGYEMQQLRAEIQRLNNHRFVRLHASMWRLGMFQFFRGLAFGLGSILGATILVSALVYLLSSIDFIPVIGEWAERIIDQISVPD